MANASAAERMQVALRKVGLANNPGVLIALARMKFKDGPSPMGTAHVCLPGTVTIDPDWGAKLDDGQLAYVGLHEMFHLTSLHFDRRADRDPMTWNVAGDLAINGAIEKVVNALPQCDRHMIRRPTIVGGGILIPTDEQTKMSAEALYEEIKKGSLKTKGNGKFGSGCGVKNGSGDGGEDGKDGPKGDELSEHDLQKARREWRQTGEAAAAASRGTATGDAFAKLAEPPPPKTPWDQLLRRVGRLAAAARGVDDKSFRRRSRRSPPDVALPGGVTNVPTVAVIIDSSGSVDDAALALAVAHTKKISRSQGFRVFFVVHDHEVKHAGWLKQSETFQSLEGKVSGRGGTSFHCAWEKVAETKGCFDAMVHLTDGEAPWPDELPRNVKMAFVALVGSCRKDGIPSFCKVVETVVA